MSADNPHDLDKVRAVMQAFTYPAAMLSATRGNGFGAPRVMPVTYVIDAKGAVAAMIMPENGEGIGEQKLASVVEPLLKSAKP